MNSFSEIIQKYILPQSLPILRENCKMAALVTRDIKPDPAAATDTVTMKVLQDFTDPEDVNTSTGNTSKGIVTKTVDIKLDQWKTNQIEFSDKEFKEIAVTKMLPDVLIGLVKSMANYIDRQLLACGKLFPAFAGTIGTAPSDFESIVAMRKILNKNLCPQDRNFLVNADLEAVLVNLLAAQQASDSAATQALREAFIGRISGFNSFLDENLSAHVGGTPGGTPAVNGAVAAGAITMAIDGLASAGTLKKGDHFTVADAIGQYVVTEDVTALTGDDAGKVPTLKFYPAAPEGGFGNDKAITFHTSGNYSLGFNSGAIGFVNRPLDDITSESSIIEQAIDPVSGLSLRFETWRDSNKKKRLVSYDILYGYGIMRPELGCVFYD